MLQKRPEELSLEDVRDFTAAVLSSRHLLKSSRDDHELYKWVFRDHFSLSASTYFRGTPMQKLSLGQKGTVLLKLLLSEGEYPLIIDQAEENLDNRFIYDELVAVLREAKNKRQIIIASNNPNLVVNSDAEQVIVARYKDGIVSYEVGSIERLEMRDAIMPILEGGRVAFKKRELRWDV